MSDSMIDRFVAAGIPDQVAARIPGEAAGNPAAIVDWLRQSGGIDDLAVARAAAVVSRLQLVDAPSKREVDSEVARLIPGRVCRRHAVLAVADDGAVMTVLMANPFDRVRNELGMTAGRRVRVAVASRSGIMDAVSEVFRSEADEAMSEIGESLTQQAADVGDDDAPSDDSAAARLVAMLVQRAVEEGASDIHIHPDRAESVIRYRVDGVLHRQETLPSPTHLAVVNRLKIQANLDIAQRHIPQDGRFTQRTTSGDVDIRLALIPTVNGESVVMRLLNRGDGPMSMADQEFEPAALSRFRRACHSSYGLVLVTGPTGSGKSTTLHSALQEINDEGINVITVEDPVEFRYPGVNQIQINERQRLTFAVALRSILRADPDVILVGELRDEETASIAIDAALTGHLVLSTLHTNDAASAIGRLVKMGIEPFLISSSLRAVVGQRLVRRLCTDCRRRVQVSERDLWDAGLLSVEPEGEGRSMAAYEPVGCDTCGGSGYRGRIAIREVLTVDDDLALMIAGGAPSEEIERLAVAHGMETMRVDGLRKVRAGKTSLGEVRRAIG